MSIESVGVEGTILDPVSMVIKVLSQINGVALVPPRSTGASLVNSCLISKVTIGASDVTAIIASCVVVTAKVVCPPEP